MSILLHYIFRLLLVHISSILLIRVSTGNLSWGFIVPINSACQSFFMHMQKFVHCAKTMCTVPGLMSGEAAKERVTTVPFKSGLLPFWWGAMRVMRSVTYMRLRRKIKEGRIASTRNSDCTDVQDEIQVESELGQKSGAYGISRSVVLKSRSSHRRYLLQPYPPPRKRRRLRTARGSVIFEPWACLRQTAFAVTCSLGHSFAARSQLGQRAFCMSECTLLISLLRNTWVLCRHYDAWFEEFFFLIWKFVC